MIEKFNQFYNFVRENKTVLAEVFKPLIDFGNEAIKIILSIFDGFEKTNGEATTLDETFNKIGNTLRSLKPVFDVLTFTLKVFVVAFKASLKPIIFLFDYSISAIKILTASWKGLTAYFTNSFEWMSRAFQTFVNGISIAWEKIKNLDFSGAMRTMENTWMLVEEIQKEGVERSANAFKTAYEKKMGELNFDFFKEQKIRKAAIISIAKEKLEQKKEQEKNTNTSPLSPKTPTGTTPSASGDSLGATTSGASTSKSTNINIDVSKIVETLNVNSTNLTESTAVIEEKITMALLKVLNNANNLANG
jgi:hypothetical protein